MGISATNTSTTKSSIVDRYTKIRNRYPKATDTAQDIGSIMLAGGAGLGAKKLLTKNIETPVDLNIRFEMLANGTILNEKEILQGFKKSKLFENHGIFLHDYAEGYPCFENRGFQAELEAAKKYDNLKEKGLKMLDRTQRHPKIASAQTNFALFFSNICKPIRTLKSKTSSLAAKISGRKYLQSLKDVLNGENAFYDSKFRDININTKELSSSAFHEMGHAMNFNKKGIGKFLSKWRFLSAKASLTIIPLTLLTALINNPNKESKSTIGKGFDFIKDHCTGLSLLCLAPTVLEEGLASIKGAKLAKGIISAEKLKKLNKFNGKAWLTYAASAAITFGTILAVDKVRNLTASGSKSVENEENKSVS